MNSNATLPRTYRFEVKLYIEKSALQYETTHHLGKLTQIDQNEYRLEGSADDLDWLARELSLLSCQFKVITPNALKQAIQQRAQDLLDAIL